MATVERTTFISTPKKDDGSGLLLGFIILAIGGIIFYVWATGRDETPTATPMQQVSEATPDLNININPAPDASASQATAAAE